MLDRNPITSNQYLALRLEVKTCKPHLPWSGCDRDLVREIDAEME